MGEPMLMRPLLRSASRSPTIRYFTLVPLSTSESTTVAPNLTWSPENLRTSMISERRDGVLEQLHAPVDEALLLLGGVVLGVLREVAVRAGLLDVADVLAARRPT